MSRVPTVFVNYTEYNPIKEVFGGDNRFRDTKDRWELSLAGRNLVGTSQYERVHISSAMQSYTLTYLRPREVVVRFCLDL